MPGKEGESRDTRGTESGDSPGGKGLWNTLPEGGNGRGKAGRYRACAPATPL